MKESIDRNFDLRRAIWGDEALGGRSGPNLRMIEVAAYERCDVDFTTPRDGGQTVWFGKCDRDGSGLHLRGRDDRKSAQVVLFSRFELQRDGGEWL